ncbi:hypothetical protein ABZ502_30185 [Streptomyces abikoensis]|uniref:hypothetical protein n=1 Tax=Streptomyces abikoensis TaxID=97398 RepID=UPI003406FE5B
MTTAEQTMWEGVEPGFRFACPYWCTMRKDPSSHYGFAERDLTLVLHYGANAGIGAMQGDGWESVGFDADRMAGSMPDGSPGRPFIRFSADEGSPQFDVHDLEEGAALLRRLSHSAHLVTRWMELAEEWDRKHPA